ncbi:hypothetical protein KAFR_0B01930 [Kazachstania africana CBS 2517]|uniref:Isocitrate lyase n=1 Tax=Kazachstania africana (strain ATCC 22294 / BCRC 22015 / CBS 2517 / CECT 1963 / NBRC 1671 / NRRL Y-8276) TaxID=1071382 RepID=H2AQ41_KAZAF|nr:hypothetical protein KAFR_0B01930 [Kazachstania africana CBS 2517]CCF56491.1 hypothetical protein KAFR_0B01930 [Kazachstania africana CBS 2517]
MNFPKTSIKVIARQQHMGTRNVNSLNEFVKSQVKEVEEWWKQDRFQRIKRSYSALDVVKHRGSLGLEDTKYPSSFQAKKLYNLLENKFLARQPVHTLGIIDPVQMTQLAKCEGIPVAYVSGWACSSTNVSSTNEVAPDFGDYPYDTVPNQVERMFKAQKLHDRKSFLDAVNSGSPLYNYMKPIIADADMGHGGPTAVMKLAKLFAEKGAAAVHIEDQLMGGKRCGHLGGIVLAPVSTHVTRLIATRLQWDIMGTENLIIARTDACNSRLIGSSSDPRDHQYIKGTIGSNVTAWVDSLTEMKSKSIDYKGVSEAEAQWYETHELFTYDEAVERQISAEEYNKYQGLKSKQMEATKKRWLSLREMRSIAKEASPKKTVIFDWDAPRTNDGYYMFKGCMEAAIERSLIFAPYADMIWLETKTPNLEEAKEFSRKIHSFCPHIKLVYNLSPSFNWCAYGFSADNLKGFIWDLAKEGFVLQLISLAGVHVNGVNFWELAKGFEHDGMLAYVDQVQKRKNTNCDLLTHQRWSGVEYVDSILSLVQNGATSHTRSTGGDSFTEVQF